FHNRFQQGAVRAYRDGRLGQPPAKGCGMKWIDDAACADAARPVRTAQADLRRIRAHPDFWYPLAWSDQLAAGAVIGRDFAGEPIALWRGKNGKVFALEDRCAHRQVPLSK